MTLAPAAPVVLTVFEYVEAPNDTVHLIFQGLDVMAFPRPRTVCGRQTNGQWGMGDETLTGVHATCKTCRSYVRRPA